MKKNLLNTLKRAKEEEVKPYRSTLDDYLGYIKQDASKGEVGVRYIFNALRDIGYIEMIVGESPAESFHSIRTILKSEGPFTGESVPDFMDFDDLSSKMEVYILQERAHKVAPLLNEISQEEVWEDRWREKRQNSLDLMFSALDMVAIELGHARVLGDDLGSPAWNLFWNDFQKRARKYLKKFSENKESFYRFSVDAFSILVKFLSMPESLFRNTLLRIAAPRESYAEESDYRTILSPESMDDVFFKTKMKFEKCSSTEQTYLYENALAQEMLKTFVAKICSANDNCRWGRLLTSLDDGVDSLVPMISVDGNVYSVHTLHTFNNNPEGWGMRKDRMQLFFLDPKFRGALFCSWKEYPTGEVLVRFDNYVDKEHLKGLLDHKKSYKKDFSKNYVKLTLDEVYKYPLRNMFFQKTVVAMAA